MKYLRGELDGYALCFTHRSVQEADNYPGVLSYVVPCSRRCVFVVDLHARVESGSRVKPVLDD